MLKHFRLFSLALLSAVLANGGLAQAGKVEEIPQCEGKSGQPLAVDNQRVLTLKINTPNQFQERARVEGRVVRLLESRASHAHFEIQIGASQNETLEVVFNKDFGRPEVRVGDVVEACGDYITSNAPTPRYRPSPAGAIIHWVHENSRGGEHPHGYIVVNDRQMFGFGRLPIEVDRSTSKNVIQDTPRSVTVVSQSPKRESTEQKTRRNRHGRSGSKDERLPRHGRNWRDWQDN